ncbi:PorP/SprF family type IX secretion system membrane protein [Flavivirga aquimarina]|uniref:PorP/SprF family type IX secretion system membrane protein n=1 Tax=Flavivirga aquimarina TaxID=2027862 RepID=A0ABT8W7E0_9FLAO|nr:PorP/SprF family type IX secretion system membrane protein [Flavivirga aquimarina]MDO5969035.1 PorP/SprF family type IX secretion system membrane protein [Flavivirga aquimarina]
MKKYLLHIILFFCFTQLFNSQEGDGVVSFILPVRNSLKFNRYAINPTFSFVREQNKYVSFNNKRQWVQFDDAPQTYLLSYSGRFRENIGIGVGLFQQNYGVLTTFGGVLNFAYNAVLNRDSNLTFGINLGFYKSGLNDGKIITNFPDPSLENIPSNSLLTVNPGINYGTGFVDFGVSLNNIFLYNLNTSKMVEDDPEKGVQAHVMYTGYVNSRDFFDESKFSGLIRSEFKKEKTVISGMAMLTVPKGIWAQAGYNTLYGFFGGLGLNISTQISIEYSYEKAMGDLSNFGSSHDITLAYKFKNRYRYSYSGDDEEESMIIPSKRTRRTIARRRTRSKPSTTTVERKTAAQIKAEADAKAKLLEETRAKELAERQARVAATEAAAKAKAEEDARLAAEAAAKAKAEEDARLAAEAAAKTKAEEDARLAAEAAAKTKAEEDARLAGEAAAKAKAEEDARLAAEAAAKAKAEENARLAAEAAAKAKAEEDARLAAEAAAKAKAEEDARLAAEAAAKAKAEEDARLAAEAAAKAKADEDARLAAEAAAKAKAEEDARLAAEAAAKAKAEEDARLAAEAAAKAKADEDARLAAKAAAKAKAEEDARLAAEAAAKAKAEEDARLAAEAAAKAKAEEDARLAAEAAAKAKAEEDARLAAEAAAKAKAEEEARLAAEAAAKAKAEEEAAIKTPVDNITKSMNDLLTRLEETVASRNQDLKDLKEENDLGEQGIVTAPKPFKSISAENAALASLQTELEGVINTRDKEITALEKQYKNSIDPTKLKTLDRLKLEQAEALKSRENLIATLEKIKVATEIERKRRIKRAAYDNADDRYSKDMATLNRIKQSTPVGSVPPKKEDFDFGEEQSSNIRIVKDVKHADSGYYLVVAVHSDVDKRDEFLRKAISAGQSNINFFYNESTSQYFIYYEKFDNIGQATNGLQAKGSKPYNGKMSMVKIEN